MEVIIQPDARRAARLAGAFIAQALRRKPDLVLGLATGSTPLLLYEDLIRRHREGLDFSRVTTFNLDEYLGLPASHPASYRHFMDTHLFRHVNIPPERIHVPDGCAVDMTAHCRDYEAAIRACGGIDIQVLGIGTDGHIGFNEPASSLTSRTRTKTLMPQTRRDNARFFASLDDVPHDCVTMGIGTILDSRTCLLLAFGEQKAEAIGRAVEGPVTAMNPASSLQLHRDTRIFLDEAAASRLQLRDYYHHAFEHEPFWQTLDRQPEA